MQVASVPFHHQPVSAFPRLVVASYMHIQLCLGVKTFTLFSHTKKKHLASDKLA